MSFDPDAYLADKPQATTFDPDAYLAEGADAPPFDPDAYLAEPAPQSLAKNLGNTLLRSAHDAWTGGIEGAERMVASLPEMAGKLAEKYTALRQQNGADSGQSADQQIDALARIQANTAQIRPTLKAGGGLGAALVGGMEAAGKDADFMQARRQRVNAALPVDEKFQQSTVGGVTAGLGQIASQIPLYLTGMGLPASIAQMYDQGYQDAKQHGSDEGTAALAGLGNMPGAALEFAADKLQLGPVLDLVKKGKLQRGLGKAAAGVAGAAATEAATEGLQQVQGNAVAKALYDEDRGLTEGVGQSMLVGGLTGGVVRGAAEGTAAALDTGKNVQESAETLKAQQEQLLAGRRPAMMFPAGTKEALELPDGFQRLENERGIFHYNPAEISAEQITELSKAGRENEFLGLGSVSKPEAMKRAAAGDPLISVTERDPAGNEIKGAVSNRSNANKTIAELEATKTPGNTIAQETPQQTLLARLRSDIEAQAKATKEAQARETAERERRQAELRGKQEQFDATMAAARQLSADPAADYPKIQAALGSLTAYAEDNALGLRQDQRNQALAEIAKLEPRAKATRVQFEQAQAQRGTAAKEALQAQQTAQAERIRADKASVAAQAKAGIGASGAIDFRQMPDADLEARANAGDKRAERELMARSERVADTRETFLDALAAVKLPADDAGMGAELKILKEDMTPKQRMALISTKATSLDKAAEALRGRGFTQIQTPDDVVTFAQRAMRGEDIRAEKLGGDEIGDVPYATETAPKDAGAAQPAPISEDTPRPRVLLTDEQIERQWTNLKKALGPVADEFDLRMGVVSEVLAEEGYTREAEQLRAGKLGTVSAATAPRVRERITELKGQRQFIVVSATAAKQEKAPGLVLHELAHPFYDGLPAETKSVLREMHAAETEERTGPLYRDGILVTNIAIRAADLPAARVKADPDLPVKEWFAERTRRLNEAWLDGEMAIGDRPLIARLARQLVEQLRKVWARIRGETGSNDLFTETFRGWLSSGTKANVSPQAIAYAQTKKRPQFATEQTPDADPDGEELKRIESEQASIAEGVDQSDPAELESRAKALEKRAEEIRGKLAGKKKEARASASVRPASSLSAGAADVKHAAAVGEVEPGEVWAAVNKLTPPQLREEQEKIRRTLSDDPDASNIEKALLQGRLEVLKNEADRRASEAVAAAPRVTALPKFDRKAALLTRWREGKALRDDGLKTGNNAAESEGQTIVNQMKARLDDEFPGWESEGYSKKNDGAIARSTSSEDDGRNLPDVPEIEYNEKAPAIEDPAPPVRAGRIEGLYGHTAHVPSFGERAQEFIRGAVVGIRGSIPELPTFPAIARGSDRFIRDKGDQFYNGIRAFYRALKSGNDFVQREAEEQVSAITTPLLKIGGRFSAADYKKLQARQEQSRAARARGETMPPGAAAELRALKERLEDNPYVLFNEFVLALDLDWRHQNLKDSAGNPIKLPNGVNGSEIAAELNSLGAKIEASPHRAAIGKAVERHMALVKRIGEDLKGRDLMAGDQLSNPYYFPHLTLEVKRGDKTMERNLKPQRVRVGTEADFRGYLVDPVGSTKAIETDYVRAMYYHLVQVGAHNLKADAVRDHVRPYDIMPEVVVKAKELSKQRGVSVSWEQAFHEFYEGQGYSPYGTDSRDAFPTVMVDRDKLARRLGVVLTSGDLHAQFRELGLRGITLQPDDLKETLIQGQRETWIVPARVAEALRGIADRETKSDRAIEAALKAVNGAWKRWKLFTPQNHVRYEYGNVIADLEKLFSASPRTFKYLGQSAREMRAFFQGEAPSDDLARALNFRSALKDGAINAITAGEINQLQRLRAFEKFETIGEKLRRQVINRASSILYQPLTNAFGIGDLSSAELSALREGITRYANYLSNLDAIRNGARPDYGGAYWKDIEAIGDSSPGANDRAQRQAAQISKSTFGDYGDLSVTGEYLRDKLIPFYSWMEVNFKYHANLLRNLRDQVKGEQITRGQAVQRGARAAASLAAGVSARVAGGFVLRLALPYAAIALWNNTGGREELEDRLSEEDRRRVHIILGEDDDGKVNVIYGNTALADVMKWFSGPAAMQHLGAYLSGRTDFKTAFSGWAGEIPGNLINSTLGSAGPIPKIGVALAFKKSTFPDLMDARTIPSYDLTRHVIGQATDDFTADMVSRIVNKDYMAQKDLGTWAKQLILQVRQRDPEQWAYYAIKDKAEDFREKTTGKSRGDFGGDSPDQQVLRNFRKAIYKGDVGEATRFYSRLLEYGYTSERFAASLRSQDPLSGLGKKDGSREAFVNSLDEFDREQLERAYKYASKLTGAKGSEKILFPTEKGGGKLLERYRANPRVDKLREVIERQAGRSDETITQQVERDLRRSLAPAR